MNPFFNSDERRSALLAESLRWIGTPWFANSAACGKRGGVSCHNLPRAILMAVGALPNDFPMITGDPNGTRHSNQSVIEPWIDGRREFVPVEDWQDIEVGDLIGIRIYRCLDHLAVCIEPGWMIHVLMHKHTARDLIVDPTWSSRILRVWRPVA